MEIPPEIANRINPHTGKPYSVTRQNEMARAAMGLCIKCQRPIFESKLCAKHLLDRVEKQKKKGSPKHRALGVVLRELLYPTRGN